MDIRHRVGSRIRELRQQLQLTQESLAYKAEVDKTYLNEVENGKRNISIINLEKVVLALEVNLEEFFQAPTFRESVKKTAKR